MWRKGAPCCRVLAVTAASDRTLSCNARGSTTSLKSRWTASSDLLPLLLLPLLRPQPFRDVSRTCGTPAFLCQEPIATSTRPWSTGKLLSPNSRFPYLLFHTMMLSITPE